MDRGWIPAFVLAAAVAGATLPGASASEERADGNLPAPVHPVCDLQTYLEHPLQEVVCGTEASAQANASVPALPVSCIQTEPGPPLCSPTTVGAEAEARGDGYVFACVDIDHRVDACGPYVAVPQPALP